jgi:predicted methyltransferase|tara:strand:+ start:232 stop:423 length:192 start_codon:yes stop_codon:yes gene_type:complete
MNIQLPECILLDDNEKQVIKDAFLSYIQDLEVKAKKDRILSVEAYEDVMDRLSEIIKKLQLAS